MPIKAKFNIDDLFKKVYAQAEDITDAVIESIKAACLQTVAKARNLPSLDASMRRKPHKPNYIDDTGVLRSSIGFVIYDHGRKIEDNFEGNGGAGQTEGMNEGRQVAEEAAEQYPDSIVAVIAAGAQYALYVESKGYDVITGPCKELNGILEQYLKAALASF